MDYPKLRESRRVDPSRIYIQLHIPSRNQIRALLIPYRKMSRAEKHCSVGVSANPTFRTCECTAFLVLANSPASSSSFAISRRFKTLRRTKNKSLILNIG